MNFTKTILNGVKVWIEEKFSTFNTELNKKVTSVEGKGLSTEDFTTEEKEKLENVSQSDWNQIDDSQLDFIKNKPDVATKDYVDNIISSDTAVSALFELDMLPVIVNDEGAIMIDEYNNILLV